MLISVGLQPCDKIYVGCLKDSSNVLSVRTCKHKSLNYSLPQYIFKDHYMALPGRLMAVYSSATGGSNWVRRAAPDVEMIPTEAIKGVNLFNALLLHPTTTGYFFTL